MRYFVCIIMLLFINVCYSVDTVLPTPGATDTNGTWGATLNNFLDNAHDFNTGHTQDDDANITGGTLGTSVTQSNWDWAKTAVETNDTYWDWVYTAVSANDVDWDWAHTAVETNDTYWDWVYTAVSVNDVNWDRASNRVVDVKAYGAIGDGITDDTYAINLANSAAVGKPVHFPKGRYKVTYDINVPTHVARWEGEKENYSGYHTTDVNGAILEYDTDSVTIQLFGYAHIKNLGFVCTGAGSIVEVNGPAQRIEGCYFQGGAHAVYGDNVGDTLYNTIVDMSTFYAQTSDIIYITNVTGASPGWKFNLNRFIKENTYDANAIFIDGTGGLAACAVTDNIFDQFLEPSAYVIDLGDTARSAVIMGNHFEDAGSVTGHNAIRLSGSDWLISGNHFDGLYYAISGDGRSHNILSNHYTNIGSKNVFLTGDVQSIYIHGDTDSNTADYSYSDSNDVSSPLLQIGDTLYYGTSTGWHSLYDVNGITNYVGYGKTDPNYDHDFNGSIYTNETLTVNGASDLNDVNTVNLYVEGVLGQRTTDYIADTNDVNGTTGYPTAKALKVYDKDGTLIGYVPVYTGKW